MVVEGFGGCLPTDRAFTPCPPDRQSVNAIRGPLPINRATVTLGCKCHPLHSCVRLTQTELSIRARLAIEY